MRRPFFHYYSFITNITWLICFMCLVSVCIHFYSLDKELLEYTSMHACSDREAAVKPM